MPRRTPLLAVALTSVLTTALTTACASQQEKYCDAVEEHQTELTEIVEAERPGDMFEAADVFRELAEDAPDDIRDDYDLMISRADELEQALVDAGIDPTDDAGVTTYPDSVMESLNRFTSEETLTAGANIEQHALDVCHTPLIG